MKKFGARRAMTLVELLVSIAIMGIVWLAFVRAFPAMQQAFRHHRLRQELARDSRITLDTFVRSLAKGRPDSVVIDTPVVPGVSYPWNSRIRFRDAAETRYEMGWMPPSFSYLRVGTNDPQILGRNVLALSFTGDYRDLSSIDLMLRIEAPTDAARKSVQTILHPSYVIAVGSQP